MLTIIDGVLHVDGEPIETLPLLPFDATVRVWAVPAAYMANGYYVDVWMQGAMPSEPACDSRAASYLGSVEYPYDPAAREAHEIVQGKARLTDAATARRWDVMTGGLTLPNGIAVGTTIDDQNRITSVVANAELAGLTDADEVDFKATSGWVRISIAQIKGIAGAIGQFVQACYSAERAHHEAIAKLATAEQMAQYDVTQGWPPNGPPDPIPDPEP